MNIQDEFRKPEWFSSWKAFAVFAFVSFLLAFGLRAFEFFKWGNPAFMVDGEFIMGTHDAYYWLAGAKGVGTAVDNPMAGMIRFLGAVTGAHYGNIAFWMPAVFAGLTAVAAFAWGMLAGGPWLGLVSGFYASCSPGFFFRTRLSYYDTDIVTVFFPLLISVCLARWLTLGCKTSWLTFRDKKASKPFVPTGWDYLLTIFAGCMANYGALWHMNLSVFSAIAAFSSLFIILLCAPAENRWKLAQGVLLFTLSTFGGLLGLILAVLILAANFSPVVQNQKWFKSVWVYCILVALTFSLSGAGMSTFAMISGKMYSYLKPVAQQSAAGSSLLYPGIAQSVIEAQDLSLDVLIMNLTGSSFLCWVGFAGFVFALILRPTLLLLLPFGLIAFASIKMGGRFAMFGGIAVGMGLSFVACFVLSKIRMPLSTKKVLAVMQCLVFCALMFGNSWQLFFNSPPSPIMGAAHAKALIESGKKMPKDSTVWTWWDWGYATMYYSGVNSFANGGHHSGRVLFPLATAYATPFAQQSNQIIKFSAVNDNAPWVVLNKMKPTDAQRFIKSMASIDYEFKPKSKQYLVVSWENIRLGYWILYYGSWNLANGGGIHPSVVGVTKGFSVDIPNGIVDIKGQGQAKISELLTLNRAGSQVTSFHKSASSCMIYNQASQQAFLVDDFFKKSGLVTLLIGNPESSAIKPYFKLVYEDFPFVRIFEVI